MNITDLQRSYDYGRWATGRLLDSAGALGDEQLHRSIGGSFNSLHATLDHLHGVEQLWLDRWLGRSPGTPPSMGTDAGIADFKAAWERVWSGQRDFLSRLEHGALDNTFEYRNQSGKATSINTRDMLIHVANHGTYHRGQIASQIRQLGGTPAPTDFLLFARDSVVDRK